MKMLAYLDPGYPPKADSGMVNPAVDEFY